ncbi:DUF3140 domain-containing protein [Streptomonospora nanhaiensis]|uniref:DUF3140 domain-containing protein n=1 Tax=Streptomonospora nanhaiensis TaxID=1323731 RepID=UPI001C9A1581|nr:DUF3140 domain-containing protein [Streptomonospora nanhaiensis]MBX9387885.1 DUF3140 domain-containing protein [Streptomonospora nanhaiensis]
MARERTDPQTEELWQEFHASVNMTGEELRRWLLTDASGPDRFGSEPSMGVSDIGRRVVAVLDKRRVDLTGEDVETMRTVVERVGELLATPVERRDDAWRHRLMTLGHDPLQPDPRAAEDDPGAGGEGPQ